MILITGGAYQGKLEFAKKLYNDRKWGNLESYQEIEGVEESENSGCFPKSKQSDDFSKQQEREEAAIAEGETSDLKQLQCSDIISHFHLWIQRLLKERENPYPLVEKLLEENPDVIIELTQLGCGVVPIEAFDREYRETVGRIGCLLAKEAEAVYLVNCGIDRRIK